MIPVFFDMKLMMKIQHLFILFLVTRCVNPQVLTPIPSLVSSTEVVDLEFESAVKQAHDSLEMFIAHFMSPGPGQSFVALKVHVTYEDGFSEDVWFDTLKYKEGEFYGMISDASPHGRTLRPGKFVLLPEKDIIDWMVVEDGKMIGGYTIRLAYQRMSADEKQRFINSLDFSIEP